MKKRIYEPPLRLILTGKCNGNCNFCHLEGNTSSEDMPIDMVYQCIDSADKLSISRVALTGGEPTLRTDLKDIINYIQGKQKISVSLTTNGYNLEKLSKDISKPIDNLNLSMSSLNEKLAEKYQNVIPKIALNYLSHFRALKKTINIVITKENYLEIEAFIKVCKEMDFSLDIMFEKRNDEEYRDIQKKILDELVSSFAGEIILQSTPVLKFKLSENSVIRIKHPYLSKLLHNSICEECRQYNQCFEKVCAVRVHPDGVVTPCLMREICFSGRTMHSKIEDAYNKLYTMVLCNDIYCC